MLESAPLAGERTPVVSATASDLAEVVDALAASFVGDPVFDWFLRDDGRREAGRKAFFNAIIRRIAFKTARIELTVGGGAAAVWLPPEAAGPIELMKELRVLPALYSATGFQRMPRLVALQSAIDVHHPRHKPYAYLWFLGVRPEVRGSGLGTALIRTATQRLDAHGLPAFLETQSERNIAFYRRHGFEITSEFRARDDAPPMWSMWREPHSRLF